MQVKGRFLEKFKKLLFLILIFFTSNTVIADSVKLELLNYNEGLKSSSAFFIQTDGETLEEGIVYIGSKRIKIEYNKPQKITIVLSEKKGMYINHELKETQYFNTHKSFVKIFFKILTGEDFFEDSDIKILNSSIIIKNNFDINDTLYTTKVIYENDPIKLRKIKVKENDWGFEIGFFNHNNLETLNKDFFSLINPYILN